MAKRKTKPALSFSTMLIVGLVVIFVTVGYFSLPWRQAIRARSAQASRPQAVACTMDAKACPDGSYVGRVAPSCEFELCPVAQP